MKPGAKCARYREFGRLLSVDEVARLEELAISEAVKHGSDGAGCSVDCSTITYLPNLNGPLMKQFIGMLDLLTSTQT